MHAGKIVSIFILFIYSRPLNLHGRLRPGYSGSSGEMRSSFGVALRDRRSPTNIPLNLQFRDSEANMRPPLCDCIISDYWWRTIPVRSQCVWWCRVGGIVQSMHGSKGRWMWIIELFRLKCPLFIQLMGSWYPEYGRYIGGFCTWFHTGEMIVSVQLYSACSSYVSLPST